MIFIVRCPSCNNEFLTKSLKSVRCRYCGKHFTVNPKSKPSEFRILGSFARHDQARLVLLKLKEARS